MLNAGIAADYGRTDQTVTGSGWTMPIFASELQPGLQQGAQFFQDILKDPPVYGGKRAPGTNAQFGQAGQITQTADPRNYNLTPQEAAGSSELTRLLTPGRNEFEQIQSGVPNIFNQMYNRTVQAGGDQRGVGSGRLLDYAGRPQSNPFMGEAAQAILSPIFQNFQSQVMPSIRDRFAAQGNSARRDIAEGNASAELGRNATQALAPYAMQAWESDQGRRLQALVQSGQLSIQEAQQYMSQMQTGANVGATAAGVTGNELSRAGQQYNAGIQNRLNAINQIFGLDPSKTNTQTNVINSMVQNLLQSGQIDQATAREILQGEQAKFEEPIYRRTNAAQALINAALGAQGSTYRNRQNTEQNQFSITGAASGGY